MGGYRWTAAPYMTVSLLMLALADLITAGSIESSDPSLGTKIRNSYLLNDAASQQPRVKLKPVKDDADAYRRLFG